MIRRFHRLIQSRVGELSHRGVRRKAAASQHDPARAYEFGLTRVGLPERVVATQFCTDHGAFVVRKETNELGTLQDRNVERHGLFFELGHKVRDVRVEKFRTAAADDAVTAVIDETHELHADFVDEPIVGIQGAVVDGLCQVGEVQMVARLQHVGQKQFGTVFNPLFLLHRIARDGYAAAGHSRIPARVAHHLDEFGRASGVLRFNRGAEPGKPGPHDQNVDLSVPLLDRDCLDVPHRHRGETCEAGSEYLASLQFGGHIPSPFDGRSDAEGESSEKVAVPRIVTATAHSPSVLYPRFFQA